MLTYIQHTGTYTRKKINAAGWGVPLARRFLRSTQGTLLSVFPCIDGQEALTKPIPLASTGTLPCLPMYSQTGGRELMPSASTRAK